MQVEQAISVLEDASLRPAEFAESFTEVARLIEARSFHMVHDKGLAGLDLFVSSDGLPILEDYQTDRWFERDDWTMKCKQLQITRRPEMFTDSVVFSHRERSKSPLFQEFYAKWDVGHVAAWSAPANGHDLGFTIKRPIGRTFTEDDVARLQPLRRAANRACLLLSAFHAQHARSFADGLDASGRPAIIFDHAGKISYLTESAAQLVGDGFSISNNVPFGISSRSDDGFLRLRRWIIDRRTGLPDAFAIERSQGAGRIHAVPVRIPSGGLPDFPLARVILMLIHPTRQARPRKGILSQIYGLTKREEDVAGLLCQALDTAELSERLRLKESSVRQVIKSVLAKVGVHRQAELVAVLHSLCEVQGSSSRDVKNNQ